MRILITSPIRQDASVLMEFLQSLELLEKPCDCDYYFPYQLDELGASLLLQWCNSKNAETELVFSSVPYLKDQLTHHWPTSLIDWMIELRNKCLDKACTGQYDYVFLVDSDTYLHPATLKRLLSHQKDIITEISWTRWYPNDPELPNVWFYPNYGFPADGISRLRTEELVKIGGFGGLALISKRALRAGVNYNRVPKFNGKYGEDRHFAARATDLGFDLWVDTTSPSFHIYRADDLTRLQMWKKNGYKSRDIETIIAVPHTGNIRADTVSYLLYTIAHNPTIGCDLSYGMPVDSNRNQIIRKFLTTTARYLLFLDSDITPPLDTVERLLSHHQKIVGALCWSSMCGEAGGKWEQFSLPYPVAMQKNPKGGWNVAREKMAQQQGLIEVDATGASCLLIHREVFEKMPSPWFKFGYDSYGICNLGEDFSFADKAKALGYSIYVDTSLQCEHSKETGLRKLNQLLQEVSQGGNNG